MKLYEWYPLKNWEPQYEITKCGLIRNKQTKKLLTSQTYKAGYVLYSLRDRYEKKNKGRMAHRLVAQTFIPNPENYPEVNHLDFNKANNQVSNLEWCSKKLNTEHSLEFGRYGIRAQKKLEPGQAIRHINGKAVIVQLIA